MRPVVIPRWTVLLRLGLLQPDRELPARDTPRLPVRLRYHHGPSHGETRRDGITDNSGPSEKELLTDLGTVLTDLLTHHHGPSHGETREMVILTIVDPPRRNNFLTY